MPRAKRTDRIDVQGCPYWQIDPQGNLYYNRNKVKPHGATPLIDLGPYGYPPVIPAYGDGSRERFVDELVAWHFHWKMPVSMQQFAYVVHADGDWTNCAADNLHHVIDRQWLYEQMMRTLMVSEIPAKRIKTPGAVRFGGIRETEPGDLRDRGVIPALPHWSNVIPTWVRDRLEGDMKKAG